MDEYEIEGWVQKRSMTAKIIKIVIMHVSNQPLLENMYFWLNVNRIFLDYYI